MKDILLGNILKDIFKEDYRKFEEINRFVEKYNKYNKYFIERHYHFNYENTRLIRPVYPFFIGFTIFLISAVISVIFGFDSAYMGLGIGFAMILYSLFSKIFETIIEYFNKNVEIKNDSKQYVIYNYFKYKEEEYTNISKKSNVKRLWEKLFIVTFPLIISFSVFFTVGVILIIIFFLLLILMAYMHDLYILLRDFVKSKEEDFHI